MLKGKKIILGISGGIAAYKSLILIRLLIKAGAEVRVVTTENALWFVTRVSLESLSQNKVYDKVFGEENDYTTEHISLTDWGDALVVAPATANIIGKYANGIADDALSTSLMAFDKQVFIAPAMNCKMYDNFAFQRNVQFLKDNNVQFVEPGSGYLACGYEGKGRMEEPEVIFKTLNDFFLSENDLEGKKIMITAGPTREKIDPVRYISNFSSGKMGYAIAMELAERGAWVQLISGPVDITIDHPHIKITRVVSAEEMAKACFDIFPEMDATIKTAAVSDYKPQQTKQQKIKRKKDKVSLQLISNQDILKELGARKTDKQILVGFALESENALENAKDKLIKKNLDFIVLNSLEDKGAGFTTDTNKITILNNKNEVLKFDLKSKKLVAKDIAEQLKLYLGKNRND